MTAESPLECAAMYRKSPSTIEADEYPSIELPMEAVNRVKHFALYNIAIVLGLSAGTTALAEHLRSVTTGTSPNFWLAFLLGATAATIWRWTHEAEDGR